MKVRILGAHQLSSAGAMSTSLLIDGVLAIDAGSVASALTLAEQDSIRAVLVTHQHHDHIKDIPALGLNAVRSGATNIFCSEETRRAILAHLLNDSLWPDLTRIPSPDHPALAFLTVEPLRPFDVGGYEALAVPMVHTVPTLGYQVSREGRRFFYTGDMGGGGDAVWPHVDPHVLIAEVTFPNRLEKLAGDSNHMTPARLSRELSSFRSLKGYLPRIVVVHVNSRYEVEIKEEVADVSQRLGADITVSHENMVVEV